MSKEHTELKVTVKCANAICGTSHTAFILLHNGSLNKIQCPACGWLTPQKKLNITQYHNPEKFSNT